MGKLNAFIDAEQLPLDDLLSEPIEDLIAEAEAALAEPGRNGHCEVEVLCHAQSGIENNGPYRYRCGWMGAHTVAWCSKRKRLMELT